MTSELLGLDGRVVAVAGAGGGGIGTATCKLLDAAGVRVVALDNDADRLALTRDVIGDEGQHHFELCDVRDADAVGAAFAEGERRLGPLTGLAHVAGGVQALDNWQPTATVSNESVRTVMALNYEGPLTTSQCFVQRLFARNRPGSIVFISSVAGILSSPFSASYGSAKAALMSLMRTQAVEWGPRQIRVNAVAPGSIRTPRTIRHGGTTGDAPEERDALPLGRRGTPNEIAGAVVFLLSDLASFVSGQVLAVDGASSVKPSYLDASGLPVFVRDPDLRARLAGSRASAKRGW